YGVPLPWYVVPTGTSRNALWTRCAPRERRSLWLTTPRCAGVHVRGGPGRPFRREREPLGGASPEPPAGFCPRGVSQILPHPVWSPRVNLAALASSAARLDTGLCCVCSSSTMLIVEEEDMPAPLTPSWRLHRRPSPRPDGQ